MMFPFVRLLCVFGHLLVYASSQVPSSKPTILLRPSRPVREGGSVTLICRSDNPDNQQLKYAFKTGDQQWIKMNGNNLVFSNLTRSHHGRTLTCGVRYNDADPYLESRTIALAIYYAPKVLITPSHTLQANQTAIFSCDARSYHGNVSFGKWQHYWNSQLVRELEGSVNGRMSKLTLRRVSFLDSGRYACRVINTIENRSEEINQRGYESVTVQGITQCEDSTGADVYVYKNSNVTLSVKINSIPREFTSRWSHGERELNMVTDGYTTREEPTTCGLYVYGRYVTVNCINVTMTIQNVSEENTGEYTSKICNTAACATSKIRLHIVEKEGQSDSFIMDLIAGVAGGVVGVFLVLIVVCGFRCCGKQKETEVTIIEKDEPASVTYAIPTALSPEQETDSEGNITHYEPASVTYAIPTVVSHEQETDSEGNITHFSGALSIL